MDLCPARHVPVSFIIMPIFAFANAGEQIAKLAVLMASTSAILIGATSTIIFIPKKDKTVI